MSVSIEDTKMLVQVGFANLLSSVGFVGFSSVCLIVSV